MNDKIKASSRYEFINYLRVFAMLCIAWAHLVANMNPDWAILHVIQWAINRPLNLIQNFGALGVSLFFIISGFLAAENIEGGFLYLKKKILRLYLPIIASMFPFYCITKIIDLAGYKSYWSQFSNTEWLYSATLWNYLAGYSDILNGVLWYLVPQILFFIELSVWKLIGKASLKFPFSVLIATFSIYIVDLFVNIPNSLMLQFHYALIPLIGYIFNIFRNSNKPLAIAAIVIVHIEIVYGFWKYQQELFESSPYINSILIACFVFLIALFAQNIFKYNGKIHWLSEISYSFYLTHSLYGGLIITCLIQMNFTFGIAAFLGIIGAFYFAYINYSFIEAPISRVLKFRIKKGK